MIALLTILAAGLILGRTVRRITPPVEFLLLFLVAVIVLAQFFVWTSGGDLDLKQYLRAALPRS